MRAAPLLLFVAAAVAACGDGSDPGDERAEQARTAAEEAGLDDDVVDFLALAARGSTATYQVTFPGTTPGTSLVVANRPPDRRVDVLDGEDVVEVRLTLDGEAYRCTKEDGAERIDTCERTDAFVEPPGLFQPAALDRLTTSLRDRREDFAFSIRDAEVAGADARCLVTEVRAGRERPELGDRGEICVSPEGALLRVEQAGESLEATEYTTDVPDGTFERPDGDR